MRGVIDLVGLEKAAYDRTPERAALAARALEGLERREDFPPPVVPEQGYARLAATLAAVFTDPEAPMDEAALSAAMLNSGSLNALFAAAGVGDTGFALEAMAGAGSELAALAPSDLARVLALMTLDADGGPDVEQVFDLPPELALTRALGLLATEPVLTARGAARRERLLEMAERLEGARLSHTLADIALAARAWMGCSYAAGPRKHRLKAVLNGAFRTLLDELGMEGPSFATPRPRPDRPTMVVIAEVMHEGHVQYRYFGQYLRQLRSRFRLVLVTPQNQLGPNVETLFDESHGFDPLGPASYLSETVALVRRLAPDVVFWPSVGMARWGPLMANLRLAPIQITALGHSASTFIPAMDYYLTEEGYVGNPAAFSETLLLLPDESLRFEQRPGYRRVAPQVREAPETLAIAVPSNLLKLNPAFLALLQRVRAEAGRPIELHVFPNAGPLQTAALRAANPWMRHGAVIYPALPPQAYLDILNACDLVLSPFPFGGLHSVVDALRQGLPVVAMEGAEPHARTDAMILRRLGMPDWLIADSEGAYLEAALRLIGDDAERVALSRQALSLGIDQVMFGDASTPLGDEVVETVWAAYRHHEAIQAAGRAAWRLPELRALD